MGSGLRMSVCRCSLRLIAVMLHMRGSVRLRRIKRKQRCLPVPASEPVRLVSEVVALIRSPGLRCADGGVRRRGSDGATTPTDTHSMGALASFGDTERRESAVLRADRDGLVWPGGEGRPSQRALSSWRRRSASAAPITARDATNRQARQSNISTPTQSFRRRASAERGCGARMVNDLFAYPRFSSTQTGKTPPHLPRVTKRASRTKFPRKNPDHNNINHRAPPDIRLTHLQS
jgi:hypothetical protein